MKNKITQKTLMIFALSLALSGIVWASDSEIGTWVRTDTTGRGMTMKIEVSGLKGGRKLTYSVPGQDQSFIMTVDSPMDGTDVPVLMNGKPSRETMAIKRVDDHHVNSVQKFNGQQAIISKGTFSPDFNTLTVEDEITAAANGRQSGKQTETWVRK